MDLLKILDKIHQHKKFVFKPSCQVIQKNLNDNGQIKIVQNSCAADLKIVFIRFDTNCRMP